MRDIAQAIAQRVTEHVRTQVRALVGPQDEYRAVFNGPPAPLLDTVFELLAAGGGVQVEGRQAPVPVLMPTIDHVGPMPPLGTSGRCNTDHLTTLRNSTGPGCQVYVVLSPPGLRANLTQTSTRSEFGLSGAPADAAPSIIHWWADPFIQDLVEEAIIRSGLAEGSRDSARQLAYIAVQAAEMLDPHETTRWACWLVLSRLWSIPQGKPAPGRLVSLACGLPPKADGSIEPQSQLQVLRELGEGFENAGFRATLEAASQGASEECRAALVDLLTHLQGRCQVLTAFTRSAPCFYGPCADSELSAPPSWWDLLTVEQWGKLLQDDLREPGVIDLRCSNALPIQGLGKVQIVEGAIVLSVELPADAAPNEALRVMRESGGAAGQREWLVGAVDGKATVTDSDPIPHSSPIRYTCSTVRPEAESLVRKGSVRVVSLAGWRPGVIVASRTALSAKLPKQARGGHAGGPPRLEALLSLDGHGRHSIELHTSPGVELDAIARALDGDGGPAPDQDTELVEAASRVTSFEADAGEAECAYEVGLRRTTTRNGTEVEESLVLRIYLGAAEAPSDGCGSEFERLVRLNRRRSGGSPSAMVHPDRTTRSSELQSWMLSEEQAGSSWYPLAIGPDYASPWRQIDWRLQSATVLSRAAFLHDPRPSMREMVPPPAFVAARCQLAEKIRNLDEGTGVIESGPLGEWLARDQSFAGIVESYLRSWGEWLEADPEAARWVDVAIIVERDTADLLAHEPYALLVSPLHPLRLAWHCLAQRALYYSHRGRPCPAAAILDPNSVLDSLPLPLRSASGGIEWRTFLSVECGSDYWGILWNGQRLQQLPELSSRSPLDAEMGLGVGGLARGFSESQVRRAMDDITRLLRAKPALNVLVTSGSAQHDACTPGLLAWCREHLAGRDDQETPEASLGRRLLNVIDERPRPSQPVDAEISNIAEDTASAVRWYGPGITNWHADLGILAQLETAGSRCEPTSMLAPLAEGALLRHRVRQQLPAASGAYLAEARVARRPDSEEDLLGRRVTDLIVRLESTGPGNMAYVFAPSVTKVREILQRADFAVLSSAAVDPACFLGGWLPGAYLWDYDMPSYSGRAGDSNGYYLLSKVSDVSRQALRSVVQSLPGCDALDDAQVDAIIHEVARRGMPTVRGLASGGRGASGDLGLLVAARLLQDEFRSNVARVGWLPGWRRTAEGSQVALFLPIDPFRAHLDDLGRSVGVESSQRPDLLVVGIDSSAGAVRIRLTAVEVKFRGTGQVMSIADRKSALEQARALGLLLGRLKSAAGEPETGTMWGLALRHLIVSMVSYGFRVYSQQDAVLQSTAGWAKLHEDVASAILGSPLDLEVDQRGRLIVIDGSPQSGPADSDEDGMAETIVISYADAGRLVVEDGDAFVAAVREVLGAWGVMPTFPAVPTSHPQVFSVTEAASSASSSGSDATKAASDALGDVAAASEPLEPSLGGSEAPAQHEGASGDDANAQPQHGVRVLLGCTVDGFATEDRHVDLSDTRLNQLNIGVVGDLGTGKTQFLKSLVLQVATAGKQNRGKRPDFLVLDYKKDYVSADFVAATGARVIRPFQMPINVFDTSGMPDGAVKWLGRFKFLADVLDKIYPGIGPVQRARLKDAVRAAYEDKRAQGTEPTIYDVHGHYHTLLGNGADSVSSIIDDLVDAELFAKDPPRGAAAEEALRGVVVVALGDLGQDDRTKNMIVAFMLNLFYERMLRTPKRPYVGTAPQLRFIDSFLLVDEADNIMRHEFEVLRTILQQGREFGAGVVLASQYLSHFKAGSSDYREPLLTWVIHKVPNVRPQELAALGFVGDGPLQAARVSSLPVHHCLVKTHGISGEVLRGTPFFELLPLCND
jgi:DNA phosphorothioation-dependent restriction protein DptH